MTKTYRVIDHRPGSSTDDQEVLLSNRTVVPDFAVALRGYDRQQVDDYIQRLTQDLTEAHARAVAAERQLTSGLATEEPAADPSPYAADLLARAAEDAEQVRRDAEQYAAALRAEAERGAYDVRALADADSAMVSAQRDALLAEARHQASEMLVRATRHADQRADEILAEAERDGAALHREVSHIAEIREQMLADVRRSAYRLLAATESPVTGATAADDAASDEVRLPIQLDWSAAAVIPDIVVPDIVVPDAVPNGSRPGMLAGALDGYDSPSPAADPTAPDVRELTVEDFQPGSYQIDLREPAEVSR